MSRADQSSPEASMGPSRARRHSLAEPSSKQCIKRLSAFALCSAVGIGILSLTSCRKQTQQVISPYESGGSVRPYAGTLEPDDGQWVRATKDYANTRYSTLDQINQSNVSQLKLAWSMIRDGP